MRSHNDTDIASIKESLKKCEELNVNERIFKAKKIYDITTNAISLATTDHERAECYELRGYCDEILNAEQRAIEDFSMAIQLSSDLEDFQQLAQRYWHRSMAYELTEQTDLMREDLQRIIQLSPCPFDTEASRKLWELDAISLQNLMPQCEEAYNAGDLKKAEDYLAEILQKNSSEFSSQIEYYAIKIYCIYREQNQYSNMLSMLQRFPNTIPRRLLRIDVALLQMVNLNIEGDYAKAKEIFYSFFAQDHIYPQDRRVTGVSSDILNHAYPAMLDQNMWMVGNESDRLRAILSEHLYLGAFSDGRDLQIFHERRAWIKEFTLGFVKGIVDPATRQLAFWQSILPNTFLGSVFYMQRGMTSPSINGGNLKEIMELLQKEINTPQVKIEMTQDVQEALNANTDLKKQLQSKFPKVYARLVQENIILVPGSLMFKQRADGTHVATTVAAPKGARAQTDADTKQRYYNDADEFSSAPTKKR